MEAKRVVTCVGLWGLKDPIRFADQLVTALSGRVDWIDGEGMTDVDGIVIIDWDKCDERGSPSC